MEGQELKASPSIIQIIGVVASSITAVAILFLLGALLKYNPEDRIPVLAEATQQAVEHGNRVIVHRDVAVQGMRPND